MIGCMDTFFAQVSQRTVIVMDKASIHTSDAMANKLEEWKERNIEIFELPSYSPEVLKSLLLSAASDRANPVTALKCIDNVNTSCLHYKHGCVFHSQWHHFCLE